MAIPHAKIRSALRKLWAWSPERRAAKKAAYVGRGYWRCETCRGLTPKPEVDHREACGATPGARGADPEASWDRLIKRMFEGELRVLCNKCHASVTKQQKSVKKAG